MQQVSAIVNGKSSHVTVYQGRKRTRCKGALVYIADTFKGITSGLST